MGDYLTASFGVWDCVQEHATVFRIFISSRVPEVFNNVSHHKELTPILITDHQLVSQ